jgi:hypothetical protein
VSGWLWKEGGEEGGGERQNMGMDQYMQSTRFLSVTIFVGKSNHLNYFYCFFLEGKFCTWHRIVLILKNAMFRA